MGNIGFPHCSVHPGKLLKDELEYRRLSQRKVANLLGLPYTALNEILNGKRPVTTDFAMIMEAALGVSSGLLLRMQIGYNLQVAQKDSKLKKRLAKIRKVAAAL
ncbi:MAG: HigA family addiction module antidote protein [Chitinophagaceae bacterium]|jgi:addiction module HigA family antidote|nr:HigA family addiction module antidote protein [Chitinophagaceae bacterium]